LQDEQVDHGELLRNALVYPMSYDKFSK
jgi:hypothetical protein